MNYWHMQLHPDSAEDWSSEDITRIIKTKKVIGLGEKWANDLGQPETFKNKMKVGDIVLVRHKNKVIIALVRVISEARLAPKEVDRDLDWFPLRRNIEIISLKPKEIDCSGIVTNFRQTLGAISPDGIAIIQKWQNITEKDHKMQNNINLLKSKKQIILQGAPGVGKTYSTAELAVLMINESFKGDRKGIMEYYHKLVEEKRIFFTTFHLSLDYEDFVEVICPHL